MSHVSTMQTKRTLNLLRATAALLVVAGHARALLLTDASENSLGVFGKAFYLLTGLGPAAVYVFFALSGYWVGGRVWSDMERGRFSWRSFGQRRLTRLLIVFWPALALTAFFDNIGRALFHRGVGYSGNAAYHDVLVPNIAHADSTATLVGNAVFLQPRFVEPFGSNGPLWSLGYEFWYYIAFPLILILFYQYRSGRWIALFGLLLVMLAVSDNAVYYGVVWLMGALASRIRYRAVTPQTPGLRLMQAACFFAIGGACIVLPDGHLARIGGAYLIGLVVAGALPILSVDASWGVALDWILTSGDFLAKRSYSIYCTHLPLLIFGVSALKLSREAFGWWRALEILSLILMASIVGVVFAYLTEARTLNLRRVLRGRTSKAVVYP